MKNHYAGILAGLILLISSAGWAQDEPTITTTKLTDQLSLFSTDQGEYTTHTIAFTGDDGLLLVDTQHKENAEDLRVAVESLGQGVPKYIINTHRHVEHIGGNDLWGADPVIIAHHLVPSKLKSGTYIFDEFSAETYPDILLYDSLTLFFNDDQIRLIPLTGSHDDNEIIVHFINNKVVHLSSLTNGFNFPSVDGDGNVLMFAPLVARAIEILPEDVIIVSGHNRTGTVEDLRAYHDMLVNTTRIVREGLEAGKELATLQEEKILEDYESYAGSYVSADEWIKYLVDAIQNSEEPEKKKYFAQLYEAWKSEGIDAAIALYRQLKQNHADEYRFHEFHLVIIGDKMLSKGYYEAARKMLELSLEVYPESKYLYYNHYDLARVYQQLGDKATAIQHCEKALELNPENESVAALLAELKE